MEDRNELLSLTAHIVSAYVEKNQLPPAHIPDLIASVANSIAVLTKPAAPAAEQPTPAVNPKKSVFPGYLISLEDGKQYKTLKRHLSRHGLTPDQYRTKWSLPSSYPMVAPDYAARRSELAKKLGLGRKPAPVAAPSKRGRKKSA